MENEEARSYYFGKITRDEAVEILQNDGGDDGCFLLRMSTRQDGVYTVSVVQGRAVRHIRVINTRSGGYVLSEGDKPCQSVWMLVDRHMHESLTNTRNVNDAISLKYPMLNSEEIIAPDLLEEASECGISSVDFQDGVQDFLEGGTDATRLARLRSKNKGGVHMEDLIREKMGDGAYDADLERFMNGKISADELQRRRFDDMASCEELFY
eukprot:m.604639 g.604639  ORF g.604639 m.604639 type:complete len:210 (+) comp22461_c0_seq6:101-730(+)